MVDFQNSSLNLKLVDSILHNYVNEFEALGTAGTGFAQVELNLKFFSHSRATRLGPTVDL
jgi:hypothetical protein